MARTTKSKRSRPAYGYKSLLKLGAKALYKGYQSYTKVKNESKTKDHADDQIHSGMDHQRHQIVLRKPNKQIMNGLSHITAYRDYNLQMSGGVGRTRWVEGLVLNCKALWNNATGAPGPASSQIAYYDLNTNRGLSGSGLYPFSQIPAADKLGLISDNIIIDMTSATSYSQIVKIHVFECIKNCEEGPLPTVVSSQTAAASGVGAFAFPAAAATGTTTGSTPFLITSSVTFGSAGDSTIGFNCGQIENFRRFWKTKKTITTYLAPGASERIYCNVKHNSVRQRDYLTSAGVNVHYHTGSVVFVYEITGAVVAGQDSGQFAIHGGASLLVSQHVKTILKQVKQSTQRVSTYMVTGQQEAGAYTTVPKQVNVVDAIANVVFE